MSSPAWLVCSLCGLKHSPRPDGRCPRCNGVLLTAADGPPSVLRPPPVSRTLSENVPAGWRIAGAAFVANGILGVVSAFVVRNPFGDPRYAIAVSSVSALLALLLGAGLLRGRDGARKAAVALVLIALLACTIFAAVMQVFALGLLAAGLCAGYLLLLVGEPGGTRLAVGSVLLAGGVALGAVAAVNPRLVAHRFLVATGMIDAEPVGRVASDAWSLTFPPGVWYAARSAPKPVPEVAFERQFLRPEGPAHAIVVSVKVPANRGFDMDRMAEAISKATRRQFDEWEVLEIAPLPGRGGTRVLHVRTTLKGQKLEMLCGLFPNPPAFYEVVVGAERAAFPRLRGELQGILESFQSGP